MGRDGIQGCPQKIHGNTGCRANLIKTVGIRVHNVKQAFRWNVTTRKCHFAPSIAVKNSLLRTILIGFNVDSPFDTYRIRLRVQGFGIASPASIAGTISESSLDMKEEEMRKLNTQMAVQGKTSLLLLPLLMVLSFCGANLTSEGESLDVVSKGSGKTHTLTLEQINVERNSDGAYLRLFDKSNKTVFVYVPENLAEKAGNLEPRKKYIYQFSVPAGDSIGTMRGDLMEVATVDGKPVGGGEAAGTPSMIILKGPAAVGESFTLEGKLQKRTKRKKSLRYRLQILTRNRSL